VLRRSGTESGPTSAIADEPLGELSTNFTAKTPRNAKDAKKTKQLSLVKNRLPVCEDSLHLATLGSYLLSDLGVSLRLGGVSLR
jgi:hypothetical protein